jgi:hypothetical protein
VIDFSLGRIITMLDLRKIQTVNILNAFADTEKMTAEMYDFLADKYKHPGIFKTICEECMREKKPRIPIHD